MDRTENKATVKPRFAEWVMDLCTRPRDRAWLDYQEEIALRHTPIKTNVRERAHTPELAPFRHLLAFPAVIITTARDFPASFCRAITDNKQLI